jgi:hypothetical protein
MPPRLKVVGADMSSRYEMGKPRIGTPSTRTV